MNKLIIKEKYLVFWVCWFVLVCASNIYMVLSQPHISIKLIILFKSIKELI